MTKRALWGLFGALALLASCGDTVNGNCNCVSSAACTAPVSLITEDCGVGLVCCPADPPPADGGADGG